MPTFCRKPQLTGFYSYLKQPYKKLCHSETNKQYILLKFSIEIYAWDVNLLLRKKYARSFAHRINQLNNSFPKSLVSKLPKKKNKAALYSMMAMNKVMLLWKHDIQLVEWYIL